MEERQSVSTRFVQSRLPWLAAGVFLILYVVTLQRWVTLTNLSAVAEISGWNWTLPQQNPLFFVLTYPLRWLPEPSQPLALNLFAAVCSALTLALLARSVALLPHDRTHEQRQRERSEHSLLTVPLNWLPVALAVLVCGLELTYWELSISGTNEILDLLVFAYCIRCLLEFRIDQNERWLTKLAFVYGLGVTNNWAMIGYFPFFICALIWIRGRAFFNLRFVLRMVMFGAAGLLLYLVLPIGWVLSDSGLTVFEALRAQLAGQKTVLLNPILRTRALVLSLTSVLPVILIGIRWPSSFGDISAAGNMLTNFMFRLVHVVFFGACLWVTLDQEFSPRGLGQRLIPFLSFYYLGALAIGYFAGYLLLTTRSFKAKAWQHRSFISVTLDRLVFAVVCVAAVAFPAWLIWKNFPTIQASRDPIVRDLAAMTAEALPAERSLVIADDAISLLLIESHFDRIQKPQNHVLVYSKALSNPYYQRLLAKRYPEGWPATLVIDTEEESDHGALLNAVSRIAKTNNVFYLQPSFGYYFEAMHPEPLGLIDKLHLYTTNSLFPPPLSEQQIASQEAFWARTSELLGRVEQLQKREFSDADYVGAYLSRALNTWAVRAQRNGKSNDATKHFQLALKLNTNNIAARLNLEFNENLRAGTPHKSDIREIFEQKFGFYRDIQVAMSDNGPFDEPALTLEAGSLFSQNSLHRQALIELSRSVNLDPDNTQARLTLAGAYLAANYPDRALQVIGEIRSRSAARPLPVNTQIELLQIEANTRLAKGETEQAERLLVNARAVHPKNAALVDSLLQIYTSAERWTEALALIDQQLSASSDGTQLMMTKANVYLAMKRNDEAIATAERIASTASPESPEFAQATVFIGLVHLQTKDWDKAIEVFDRVLKRDPDHVDALVSKGAALLEKKDFKQAIEALSRALRYAPSNWAARRNRAISYLRTEQLDDAREDYQILLQLLPRYHAAYYGLGEIALRQRDFADAIKYYERYLKYAPTSDVKDLVEERKLVTSKLEEAKAARR